MQIYDTERRAKREFTPREPGKVAMYVCGPTVYDQIHIGNGRTFVAFDAIRRYLEWTGLDVTFVQNLTDVDDKIINRAAEEGRSAAEVASDYTAAFREQMVRMGVEPPTVQPKATEEIPQMIELIEELVEKGHAYATAEGDVYFSVSSCPTYGEVSGRRVEDLLAGARVEVDEAKRESADFALWKAAKPGEPSWESPWGLGRPGWHTECVAMAKRYLGVPIDIHGGGSDLVFPHHENENAQAEAAWGTPLARLWMHSGMLRVDGEKMSKSLGNFHTLKDVLDRYPADALRLLVLQTHYRSPLDFSFERLEGARGAWERMKNTVSALLWAARDDASGHTEPRAGGVPEGEPGSAEEPTAVLASAVAEARAEFSRSMEDDFNTAGALGALFTLATRANTYLAEVADGAEPNVAREAADALVELFGVLGINVAPEKAALPAELVSLAAELADYAGSSAAEAADALIAARAKARAARDWARADAIRDRIAELGLAVEDTPTGSRVVAREG